jgi:HK97 family phage portal protein
VAQGWLGERSENKEVHSAQQEEGNLMAVVISEGRLARIDRADWTGGSYGMRLYDDRYVLDLETLYRTQPTLKTVVDFLSRNVGQLGLKVYRRLSDTDREHLPNHPLSKLLSQPNAWTTRFAFWDSVVHDLCVFGNSYTLKRRENGGPVELWRLPPQQVSVNGPLRMRADSYTWRGNAGEQTFAAGDVMHVKTWNPSDPRVGLSPLESLRRILAEEAAADEYREFFWRNRARPEVVVKYPGQLSDTGLQRLRETWRQNYEGGENSGRTAFLEENADVTTLSQSFNDAQYFEIRKLTREEVAAAFHIPPPMVGLMERTNYSNMREAHRQLYQDTLGPTLEQLRQEVELQLLPEFEDTRSVYVEFNLAAKLAGSFEEAATQLQTSVGAPYMSRNEARARLNLPHIEDGDGLVTPLNVLVGGQASPTDSAPPPKSLPRYEPDAEATSNGKH